jgi:hypothetical protein
VVNEVEDEVLPTVAAEVVAELVDKVELVVSVAELVNEADAAEPEAEMVDEVELAVLEVTLVESSAA